MTDTSAVGSCAGRYLMQVEKKRACTSCGSENAPDAGSRVVVFLLVRRR
jgi:hypothetical protein